MGARSLLILRGKMNQMPKKFTLWTIVLCLMFTIAVFPSWAQSQPTASSDTSADTATKKKSKKKAKKDAAAGDTSTTAADKTAGTYTTATATNKPKKKAKKDAAAADTSAADKPATSDSASSTTTKKSR